ncbi:MAG: hypothetical protein ABSC34_05505 [Acidimicrobiales bacterium]
MTSTNRSWFDRAQRVLPGGVDSPVRSFRSVGGTPYTVLRGEGAYVEDVPAARRSARRPPGRWSSPRR